MRRLLAYCARVPPVRRLLGRFRYPRPSHLGTLTPDQFHEYVKAAT